jgi:curved DNA-binding protein CbpA
MRVEAEDYYAILHLNAGATGSEIHRAYRVLAMQYHPDRNPAPEAASIMAQINEAYSVLSDPARRRKYDKRQRMSCENDLALPIVAAARAALLRQRWTVLHDDGSQLILEDASRRVRVNFIDRLTDDKLRKLSRQCTEFTVVLAVEMQRPINLSLQIAVIDLVHSKHYGAAFPDEHYRALFQPFLCSGSM